MSGPEVVSFQGMVFAGLIFKKMENEIDALMPKVPQGKFAVFAMVAGFISDDIGSRIAKGDIRLVKACNTAQEANGLAKKEQQETMRSAIWPADGLKYRVAYLIVGPDRKNPLRNMALPAAAWVGFQ